MRPEMGSAQAVHCAPVRTEVGVQWVRAEEGRGRVVDGKGRVEGCDLPLEGALEGFLL